MKAQLNLPVLSLESVIDAIGKGLDYLLPSRLDMLDGKQVVFTRDKRLKPVGGWDTTCRDTVVHRLERVDIPVYVFAVDSSCILVGETIDGSIYSAKCTIAVSFNGRPVTHALIGPLLFYIHHDDNRDMGFMGIDDVKRMIRVRLERLLQYELAGSLKGVILLVDGALRRSMYEHAHTIQMINDRCRVNGNVLVGLSKSTRFRELEGITSLLSREGYPCYTDVTVLVEKTDRYGKRDCHEDNHSNSNSNSNSDYDCLAYAGCDLDGRGRVYSLLAKLTVNGLVFRADVLDDPQRSLGMLIANDAFHNGYPESLRIAHHTSIFTSTDVLCIKSFMKSRFNIREVDGDDVRRVLLGSV